MRVRAVKVCLYVVTAGAKLDIQIVLKMKTLLGVLWCCWLLTLTGNTDLVF